MGFNRDVIRRRRDQLHEWGVRMRWVGRRAAAVGLGHQGARGRRRSSPSDNTGLTLYFCVNYGGRAEIADAVRAIAEQVAARPAQARADRREDDRPPPPRARHARRRPVRAPSGEQRTSNFLLWQSAYAEMVFQDTLWPDYDRRHLWQAIETYAERDRRYGGAVDRLTRLSRRSGGSQASRSRGSAGAEDLQGVGDVGEAVLGADPVGPPLDRRALDLDGAPAASGRPGGGGGAGASSGGRPPRPRRCAACRPRRGRPAPAGCGRPWPGRPCRRRRAAARAGPGRTEVVGAAEAVGDGRAAAGSARMPRSHGLGAGHRGRPPRPRRAARPRCACLGRARRSAPRGVRAGGRRGRSRRGRRGAPPGGRTRAVLVGVALGAVGAAARPRRVATAAGADRRRRRTQPMASSDDRAARRGVGVVRDDDPADAGQTRPTSDGPAHRGAEATAEQLRGGDRHDHQRADEQQPDDPHRDDDGHGGEHRQGDVEGEHRHPDGPRVLLVAGHREQPRPQQPGGEQHDAPRGRRTPRGPRASRW